MDHDLLIALICGLGVTVLVVSIFIIVFVRMAAQSRRKSEGQNNVHSGVASKYSPVANRSYVSDHAAHVADVRAHSHKGEEEHYEQIVGSLGDVNDEGCADLDGVRLIAHDAAYDTTPDGARDYSATVRAMVLGEVLNEPRFKHPYRGPRR